MVCVLDSLSYNADAYILDVDGVRIGCTETMKVLGMHFSNRLTMQAQVDAIQRSMHRCF